MPRQAGKTVLARVSQVSRAATREEQKVWYTAQTGIKARERWLDTVAALEHPGSPFRRFVNVSRGAGSSAITFPNRSFIRPFPPTSNSLHSETPHRVDLDEIWDYTVDQGDSLIQAIKPAQLTLRDRQIWLYSAAGEKASQFMWTWVLIGRAAAANPNAKIAYVEWSAPDDADSYDPQTWRDYHPGVGHLIDVADIADAIDSFPNRLDFDRAYNNRWAPDEILSPIPAQLWNNRHDRELAPAEQGAVVLAYDVAPDRSEAAILASWRDVGGRLIVATVAHQADATWLLDKLPEWIERLRPVATAADSRGETRWITDRMRRRGLDIHELTSGEYATACGSLLTAATAEPFAHDGSVPLADAVKNARTRPLGGSWVWDETRPRAAVLRAATVAAWTFDHPPEKPAPIPKAKIRTLSG